MTSSQFLGFGLISGGLVLLAFLLIQFSVMIRKFWLHWALVGTNKLHTPRRLKPLAHFSDEVLPVSSTPEPDPITPLGVPAPHHLQPKEMWRWLWLLLLFLAVMMMIGIELGLLAILTEDTVDLLPPLFGIIVAGLLFAFVCRKVLGRSVFEPFKAILPQRSVPPAAMWLTNLCLTLVVLSTVNLELPNPVHYFVFALWLVNIALFCWNILQMAQFSWPSRESVREWWQTHKVDMLLLGLIALGAFLIRVIGLETYPYAFINDEGEVGWEALNLLHGYKSNLFEMGWAGQTLLSFLPVAFSIKIFGITAVAVRIVSVVQGTLAVMALYLLAREAFGRPVAVLSACLLAALPWHVHFSRLGVVNVSDSLFSAAVLWLTYRALRKGRYIDYLLAGLVTGFSLYTYVGSRLVVAMAIGVLAYTIIRQRSYLVSHFRHLAVFFFAFLIVAVPAIYSFATDVDQFMGRLNQEGLLANNRLQQLSQEIGMSESDYMNLQVQKSTTVFFGTPALGQFFNAPRPYLVWWAAVFLFLGMVYIFWNITQVRYMMLLGWFWAPILIGSALTYGPPSHQRMLAAAPALVLLVAISLWKLAQALQKITRIYKVVFVSLCLLFVGITAWQDINFYFVGPFRTERRFEVEGNEFSYEVGLRAGTLGPNYRLLLIGDPDIYAPFANFHYFTDLDMPIDDFNTVTPETIAALPRDKGFFFAAIPSRMDELKLVQQHMPGGAWDVVELHTQEGILYYAYILAPPSTAP